MYIYTHRYHNLFLLLCRNLKMFLIPRRLAAIERMKVYRRYYLSRFVISYNNSDRFIPTPFIAT